jgi:hypothetical protein
MARTSTRQLMGDRELVHQPLVPGSAAAVGLGPKRHRTGMGQRADVGRLGERGPIDQQLAGWWWWGSCGTPGCARFHRPGAGRRPAWPSAGILEEAEGLGLGAVVPGHDLHLVGALGGTAQKVVVDHGRVRHRREVDMDDEADVGVAGVGVTGGRNDRDGAAAVESAAGIPELGGASLDILQGAVVTVDRVRSWWSRLPARPYSGRRSGCWHRPSAQHRDRSNRREQHQHGETAQPTCHHNPSHG